MSKDNMISKPVIVETTDGRCDAHVAYPADGKKHPPVLLYMDAFGLRPYLIEMTEKLASYGYYVLTPNLFYRSTSAPIPGLTFPMNAEEHAKAFSLLRPLIQQYDTAKMLQDGKDFIDWLQRQKEVKSGPVAITGYCMGGRLGLQLAAEYPDQVALAAGFHVSRIVTDAPDSVHKRVPQIKAFVYMGYADQDAGMTPEQIAVMEKALKDARVRHECELYKGALHGYTMADLPPYNAQALKKHWEKLPALLKQTLG